MDSFVLLFILQLQHRYYLHTFTQGLVLTMAHVEPAKLALTS